MKSIRYILLAFLLAPSMALAQNIILDVNGVEYPAQAALFGVPFENGVEIGPEDLVQALDEAAGEGNTTEDGCEPFTNGDDIEGNIALISRGACAFVQKVQNAAAAGAVAVVVYNNAPRDDDPEGTVLVNMAGDCTPEEGCPIPAAFTNRVSYEAFLPELKFGAVATLIPDLPVEPTAGFVDTGVVTLPIYDNGLLGSAGSDFGYGQLADEPPFTFNDFTPLFVATALVGIDGNVVTNPYETSEFARGAPVAEVSVGGFDQALVTNFSNEELGIDVENLTVARDGDPFVFSQFRVTNTSGGELNDVYIGLFADFDVVDDDDDASTNDSGGYNPDLGMPYIFDADMTQYYGILPIADVSGYTVDAAGADEDLFTALTSAVPPNDDEAERAAVVGTGPFTIADGENQPILFAFVAGSSEAELFENAAAAIGVFVSNETETAIGTYRLESAYPNPFAARTNIGFTLPVTEEVTVAVYDMLGRQVAVLAEGVYPAGAHTVEFDATNLPSGVYVYRLTAGSTSLTERMTVVR